MRNSAKLVMLVAVGAPLAFIGCSSSDDSSSSFGGSGNIAGSSGHAGTSSSGGTSAQGGTSVGVSGGGSTGDAGTSTSGGSGGAAAGTGGAAAGTGGAAAGTGGASGGSGGAAAGSGGTGGASNAVVATCGTQMYTPTATPGGVCVSNTHVPTVAGIATFDDGTAPGWGVYANGTGGTFTPATATPSAPGANGTAMSLGFTVTNDAKGIRIEAGFGNVCQDVRAFTGLSFWAKGTIEAATTPSADFPVDASTLVITLGSELSAQGGCTGGSCLPAPDKRVTITADWREYRVPFNCFGPDGTRLDGYLTDILFNAYGTTSNFAIDQVSYY